MFMAIKPEFFTTAVHAGAEPEPITGAVMTPIFQTSTYVQESPGCHRGFDYSRADNPTRQALEKALAELENARFGLSFSSGLAAVQAVVQTLQPGDQVLVCDDVYGGTGRLFRQLFSKYNIEFIFLDMNDKELLLDSITTKTKMFWVETPTNPTLKVIDIQLISDIAKKSNALLVVDNTFPSPAFQQPLFLGADIVLHSTTKYIGGHSDLIGGALMTNDQSMFEQLKFIQFAAGSVPSPFESFLILRSIKTLAVRMIKHEENAMVIADYLQAHPKVSKIFYPGLECHPHHQIAKKQMLGFSGMLSFELKSNYNKVVEFTKALKIFCLAESLGGVESLINHPEKMTHASVPENLRQKLGIGPSLLRLSVGIESAADLIDDLKQAFEKV